MRHQHGYIAILTVILIMAVVVIATTTISLLSIGEAQSALSLFIGGSTLDFVEGCAEDALLQSRDNASFGNTSPVLITRPEGTCQISVTKNGTTWTIDVTTTATTYVRTIEAIISRTSSQVTLTSWQEKIL